MDWSFTKCLSTASCYVKREKTYSFFFFLMGNVSNKDSPEICFQEACVHIWVQSWAGGKAGFLISSSAQWYVGDLRFAAIGAAVQETAKISLLP